MKASVTAYALQGVAGWYVCSPWAAFIPLGDAKMWRIPQKKKKEKEGNSLQKAQHPSEKMSCAVVSMGATARQLLGYKVL